MPIQDSTPSRGATRGQPRGRTRIFSCPEAGRVGPFALQMHNEGLFDEYANIAIEENPKKDELITTAGQTVKP